MLHIVNGLATLNLLDRTDIRGARLSGDDIFAEGPVIDCLENERSWAIRADYLQERFKIPKGEYLERRAERERGLRSSAYHEEIVLWFEFDLFCQMNLLYLLNWFSQRDLGNSKLSLICPGSFPGMKQFRGLGTLSPKQLASLFLARDEVSSAQKVLAVKAWKAYGGSDPTAIERLLEEGTDDLPYLRSALYAHLERFPFRKTGLNQVQTRILELVAESPRKFLDLVAEVSSSQKLLSHGMGDVQFSVYLSELAEIETPLLKMENSPGILRRSVDQKAVGKWTIRITDAGREVLSGKQNLVKMVGIDRWLGGVHLKTGDSIWWWDQDKQRLAREEA